MSFNDLEQGLGPNNSSSISARTVSGKRYIYFCTLVYILISCFFLKKDDDRQFKELTQRIAQQIFHINGNISSIERLVNLLGGSKDTSEIRGNL